MTPGVIRRAIARSVPAVSGARRVLPMVPKRAHGRPSRERVWLLSRDRWRTAYERV